MKYLYKKKALFPREMILFLVLCPNTIIVWGSVLRTNFNTILRHILKFIECYQLILYLCCLFYKT